MPELRLAVSPEARDETVKFLRHLAAWSIAGTTDPTAQWCAQRAAELLKLYPPDSKTKPRYWSIAIHTAFCGPSPAWSIRRALIYPAT
jgi:hypothetical protein